MEEKQQSDAILYTPLAVLVCYRQMQGSAVQKLSFFMCPRWRPIAAQQGYETWNCFRDHVLLCRNDKKRLVQIIC
jgi:hypothetical protein